jgi:hypothetical protein
MRTSKEITSISKAFLKAQKEIESVKKGSSNPFFKSKYADINSILEACKSKLNENGISILQPTSEECVETILMHESGEWFRGKTKIINAKPNDPQAQGSAITYARRYGLQSMLSMMAEDDDGERAVNREIKASKYPRTSEMVKGDISDQSTGLGSSRLITEGQRKAVFAIATQQGWLNGSEVCIPDNNPFKISDLSSEKASAFIKKYGNIKSDEDKVKEEIGEW